MLITKLIPLQLRFAASILNLLLFSVVTILHPSLAHQAKPEESENQDLSRLLQRSFAEFEEVYESDILPIDGGIIERQVSEQIELKNNVVEPIIIERGRLVSFVFTNNSLTQKRSLIDISLPSNILESKKQLLNRDTSVFDGVSDSENNPIVERAENSKTRTGKTLYLTVTTCTQPRPVSNSLIQPPPQLQLYVSVSPLNRSPGPSQDAKNQIMVNLKGGYALQEINASGDVFIGLFAKNDNKYTGDYSAQIAASIDMPYHFYQNSSDPNVFAADTDSGAALLYTEPFVHNGTNKTLVEAWTRISPPFVMFGMDREERIMGLENSYCGLERNANIFSPSNFTAGVRSNVNTRISTFGEAKLPRQEIYIEGLKPGKTYTVALAMASQNTEGNLGGGGWLFHRTSFSTLSDESCDVIFGLSFCDKVAYSVPTNHNKFPNRTSLAAFYDNSTKLIFENFEKALAQIPCEIAPSGQYSLARTCKDCAQAYKAWLCAVNIPRCTDINSRSPWLHPRAIGQAFLNGTSLNVSSIPVEYQNSASQLSRNANIDEFINPGPYKEVLPCQELCHNLVSSCPAKMGFGCPEPGQFGFNSSYGEMPNGYFDVHGRNTNITCNFPGSIYFSAASSRSLPLLMTLIAVVLGGIFVTT